MKFNLKSKLGFTLIELLVVIGILAVLAAIAIPSVAGLIDRANISADATNANEMTNAVERFVSEYELYCQDIASGRLDLNNLDAAQGRVRNVTSVTLREHIEKLESKSGYKGKGIDIDTKYPSNEETLKTVIENYMKTSSTTFTPKQSDCEYYYSPELGNVIVCEKGATIEELNKIAFSDENDAQSFGTINWIILDETNNNIATETKGNSGTLNTEINEVVILTITINGQEYQFEDGMTWNEWIDSKYCTLDIRKSDLSIDNGTYYLSCNFDTWCFDTRLNKYLCWSLETFNGNTFMLSAEYIFTDIPDWDGGFSEKPTPYTDGYVYFWENNKLIKVLPSYFD